MQKKVGSFSKTIDVDEVKAAIFAAAGAKKADKAELSMNMDGSATVSYTITKTRAAYAE